LPSASTTTGDNQQIGEPYRRRRHDRGTPASTAADCCAGDGGAAPTDSDGEGLTALGYQYCFDQRTISARGADVFTPTSSTTCGLDLNLLDPIGNSPGVLGGRIVRVEIEANALGVG